MSDQDFLASDPKLSPSLLLALRDCVEWHRHRPYVWKPKSMEKLEKLGFVERDPLIYSGMIAYAPTEKGRDYLVRHK